MKLPCMICGQDTTNQVNSFTTLNSDNESLVVTVEFNKRRSKSKQVVCFTCLDSLEHKFNELGEMGRERGEP